MSTHLFRDAPLSLIEVLKALGKDYRSLYDQAAEVRNADHAEMKRMADLPADTPVDHPFEAQHKRFVALMDAFWAHPVRTLFV